MKIMAIMAYENSVVTSKKMKMKAAVYQIEEKPIASAAHISCGY
jgi:hypothetical protein